MENRRNFLAKVSAFIAIAGVIPASVKASKKTAPMEKVFVHHVFFWLKEPANQNACKEFEKGLSDLVKVPQITWSHVGKPVESTREVVDDSFTYSYMAFFKNKEDQDVYQTHPIHLKFIDDCNHLWEKVIVYDALN